MKEKKYPKLYPKKGTRDSYHRYCYNCGEIYHVSNEKNSLYFPCCNKFAEGSMLLVNIDDQDDYNLAYYIRYTSDICSKSDGDALVDLGYFEAQIYEYRNELLKIESHLLRQERVDEIVSGLEKKVASKENIKKFNMAIDSFIFSLDIDSATFKMMNKNRLNHWNLIINEYYVHAERIRNYEDLKAGFNELEFLKSIYEIFSFDYVYYGYKHIFTDDKLDKMWLPYEQYVTATKDFCCVNCGSHFESYDFQYKLCLNCYKLSKNNLIEFDRVSYKDSNLQRKLMSKYWPIHSYRNLDVIKNVFTKYGEYAIYDNFNGLEEGYEFIYYLVVFDSLPETIFIMKERESKDLIEIISFKTLLINASDETISWFKDILDFLIRDMPKYNVHFKINNDDYN